MGQQGAAASENLSVADAAVHVMVASATFTIEDNASSGGPSLSELNTSEGMTLPDTAELWVQGRWSGSNTKVFVSGWFGELLVAWSDRWSVSSPCIKAAMGENVKPPAAPFASRMYASIADDAVVFAVWVGGRTCVWGASGVLCAQELSKPFRKDLPCP